MVPLKIRVSKLNKLSGRKREIQATTCGFCAKSAGIAFFIRSKPKKRSPNPTNVSPMRRTMANLGINWAKKPIAITGKAKSEICILKPNKLTIHAVIVVPILAPKITPKDWYRFNKPALAKPTTITVVALDDWIILVTKAPQVVAAKRFVVAIPNSWRILSPDTFCRPSLIIFIPNKNTARPPSKFKISSRVDICGSSPYLYKKKEPFIRLLP